MKNQKNKEKRLPTFSESIISIIFMAITLLVGKGIFNIPTEICLIISAIFAGAIAILRLNHDWASLEKLIVEKIAAVMPPVLIVIFVGFMISAWCFSGTLPMLVYYGMKVVLPKYLFVLAFILSAILSYVSGASWGAVASIGVAMMGIGEGLGVNLAILASAVITGAYFGDKLSPLSDSTNLAAAVTKVPLYDHVKCMLWTTIPSTVIALTFYFIIGINTKISGDISSGSLLIMDQLETIYGFGIIALLPMLIVLFGTLFRMPTIPVMIASGFVGILIGAFYQGFPIKVGIDSLIYGFNLDKIGVDSSSLLPSVLALLNRGGLANSGEFMTFIFCAMGFAGIVTGTGMMNVAMNPITKLIKSVGVLVVVTEIECIVVSLLTGSGGLTKIIPGELMMKNFLDLRVHPKILARTTEDAGTMVGPIVPWSAAGVYMVSTLGVPVMEYFPYCILFFSSMIIAAIYAFTGIGITKITDEEAIEMAKERGVILKGFEKETFLD